MADPERAEMSASEIEQAETAIRDWVAQPYYAEMMPRVDSVMRYAARQTATLAARDKRIEALETALRSVRKALDTGQATRFEAISLIDAALQPTPTEEADDGN